MRGILAVGTAVLILLSAGGCGIDGWQANRSSQAVDVDPFGEGIKPAGGPGYMNGQSQDMRSHH